MNLSKIKSATRKVTYEEVTYVINYLSGVPRGLSWPEIAKLLIVSWDMTTGENDAPAEVNDANLLRFMSSETGLRHIRYLLGEAVDINSFTDLESLIKNWSAPSAGDSISRGRRKNGAMNVDANEDQEIDATIAH